MYFLFFSYTDAGRLSSSRHPRLQLAAPLLCHVRPARPLEVPPRDSGGSRPHRTRGPCNRDEDESYTQPEN